MFLSSSELILFYIQIKSYSTKELFKLEYFLRYNNACIVYNQFHTIVKTILIKRIERIIYLNKCLSVSNPMGRLSARLIGYIGSFVKEKKIREFGY